MALNQEIGVKRYEISDKSTGAIANRESIKDINKTTRDKRRQAKKRVRNSILKVSALSSALQIGFEYWNQKRQHDINLIGLVDGNSYKEQIASISRRYEQVGISSAQNAVSAFIVGGGFVNPIAGAVVAVASGAISAVSGVAGIEIDRNFKDKEARISRRIDAVNVQLARRALSVGSVNRNRNIENSGVLY